MEPRGSTRVGLVAGVSLALGLGLLVFLWWTSRGEPERGTLARAPSAEPPQAPAPAEPVLSAPPLLEPRANASGPRAGELERAVWVEGQVLFAPGTPADEAAFVLARGNKEFDDGSLYRAPVAADGSFRVAFAERSKTGWLLLEARYGYLKENYRWKKGSVHPLLEPQLGGCLEGRVVAPAGDVGFVGGRLSCASSSDAASHEPAAVELRQALTFAFCGLAPGRARLRYEGGRLWAGELAVEVEPGIAHAVELELRLGAVLAGRVLDARRRPLSGVDLNASGDGEGGSFWRSLQSARDGDFRLCVPPGSTRLVASLAGHGDVELACDALAAGEVRTGLDFVFASEASLAGRVTWPDGKPAWPCAVMLETDERSSRNWVMPNVGTDGRFRAENLGVGPFSVRASARSTRGLAALSSPEWIAVARHVPADTTDLELVLALAPVAPPAGARVRVHGRVWIGGRPAARAFLSGRARGVEADEPSCRSAEDGSYELLLAPGAYQIGVADAEASVHEWLAVEVPRVKAFEHDLRLAVGRVSGRVFAADGSALAGVRVQAQETSATTKVSGWASTLSDGRGLYELLLPAATYELSAGGRGIDTDPAPSFALARLSEVVVTSGTELRGIDFELQPGAVLEGVTR